MLAFAWQFGLGNHPAKGSLLPAFLMIAGFALSGGILLLILTPTVPRIRRRIRARLSKHQRLRAAATSELRSRVQMDELCPQGWQAQIVVFSAGEQLPPEAPHPDRTRVALDWAQLHPGASPETLVVRRVWAPTISGALEAMVADRVTDETLQEIEQMALADGAEWPDE